MSKVTEPFEAVAFATLWSMYLMFSVVGAMSVFAASVVLDRFHEFAVFILRLQQEDDDHVQPSLRALFV